MDFFESQDRARRQTGRLVFFYLLAVALIVASLYFVVLFTGDWAGIERKRTHPAWHPELLLGVSAATIAVILVGSIYRILQLRSGGSRVAELMGGRRVNLVTTDPEERRLINVVEEMAIASGVPVPEIFIMDREDGINAFAAGYTPGDAAVAVTRGCLQKLDRDELQGIIAHEFSHILNGDMRINIRLIGVLNGILLLHLIGFIVIRAIGFGGVRRSRSSDREGGGGGGGGGGILFVIAILGLALIIIGYIGVLCSRMIQAAISRQREFLADAAAVQFTRNPDGIADALKKIGGARFGARVRASHAMEVSHMFFANGIVSSLSNIFATHPPLTKRIRAIDPSFDGKSWIRPKAPESKPPPIRRRAPAETRSPFTPITGALPMSPEVLLASVGTVDSNHVSRAGQILAAIPEEIKAAAREPIGAQAITFSILLSQDPTLQSEQFALLSEDASPETVREVSRLHEKTKALAPELRLPLVDLAVPALRQLSPGQFQTFRQLVAKLIASDRKLSLFEFSLEKVLMRHLESHFKETRRPVAQYYSAQGLTRECSLLLSALAHTGSTDSRQAFAAGQARLPKLNLRLEPLETCTLDAIDVTLNQLNLASFPVKKHLLDAAIAVIVADGNITPSEAELVRAIADTLDCPMPPHP